jgi:hypothetical protein
MLEVLPENMIDLKNFDVCDKFTRSVNRSRYGRIASQTIFASRLLRCPVMISWSPGGLQQEPDDDNIALMKYVVIVHGDNLFDQFLKMVRRRDFTGVETVLDIKDATVLKTAEM